MKEIVGRRASNRRRSSNRELRYPEQRRGRENGAVAIMFACLFLLIIGFFALALDMARIYNRRAEMQAVADSIAISAAKRLNGTAGGISDAVAAARNALGGDALDPFYMPKYNYNQTMVFSEAAIMFGSSSDGSAGWLTEAEAIESPSGLAYVRVDTSELDGYGTVKMLLIPVLSTSLTSVTVDHTAVAGRGSIGVTPIAICAMSTAEAERRQNPGNDELIQYGFRRGVSYDLMKLSSYQDAATNFLVDPISPPGSSGAVSHFDLSIVGPYVCTGTVALPRVSGASISVQSGFPIGTLFHHLNSRFNLSNGRCDTKSVQPDSNIKKYDIATGINWMSSKPSYQSALRETATDNKLRTIADLDPPNIQTPTDYGPLWVYARAVPWSSYKAGKPEPYNGYTPFAATTAIWASLYSTGPGLSSYPDPTGVSTPYSSQSNGPPIASPGKANRRVLHVPLVQCPVSGSTATVLAIGKFFMTVPADGPGASIPAEFAGIATEQAIAGPAELYP